MAEYIDKQAFKDKYLCCGYLPEMSEEEFDAFPTVNPMTNEQALSYFKRRKEQFGLSDMVQRAEDCAIKALERVLEWEENNG